MIAESADMRRAAVDAIIQSASFRRSPRLREMLVHIANATLNGDVDELTETRIAAKVFGRPEYNRAEDNLVCVSARQLRTKISEYYDGEGRYDEVILEVPKGGYLGVFHNRTEFQITTRPTASVPAAGSRVNSGRYRVVTLVLGAAVAGLLVLVICLWKQNRQLQSSAAPVTSPVLFDLLIPGSGQRTNLVLTDSALIILDQLMHRDISLADYASRRYLRFSPNDLPGIEQTGLLPTLRSRQISSLADLRILSAVLQRYPRSGAETSIHHARDMQVRDFDTGDNFVIIGSPVSNPWASLFEKPLAFELHRQHGNSCFENVHAAPGEQRMYCVQDPTNEEGTDYAHVAVLHTGNGRGRVLLIAGADMESTEAAGAFVLNPRSVPPVLKALGVGRAADLPDFELLLKADSVAGSGRSPELIYAHKL